MNSTERREVDLVMSLGGSCVAAMQIKRRGLWKCFLPFDWLFHVDGSILPALESCFKDDFRNWLRRENLMELPAEERGTSRKFQYKDLSTGFRFIHDFDRPLGASGEYEKVKRKYDRRIRRMYDLIGKAERVVLVLNAKWEIDAASVESFLATLKGKWPGVSFEFVGVSFGRASDTADQLSEECKVLSYSRAENSYDYFETNFEWRFLDDLGLRERNRKVKRWVELKSIQRGVAFYLAQCLRPVPRLRLKLFGFRLDLCLGKASE